MTRRTFATLDGLRGVAALLIVARHLSNPIVARFQSGNYLVVDMFFALSGFVLAHAYQDRLGTAIGWRQFAIMRLIRFYPLYLLGTVLGVIAMFLFPALPGDATSGSPYRLAAGILLALCFLPTVPRDLSRFLYPFNFSAWSLLAEFVVNVLFALVARRLTDRRLLLWLGVSAALLASLSWRHGGVEGGWRWSGFMLGQVRGLYGFFAGIAVYRLWAARRPAFRIPSWIAPLLLIAIVAPNPTGHARALYDVATVTLLFPALIYLGASIEPSPALARPFRWLGVSSYGVYALQSSVDAIARRLLPWLPQSGGLAATLVLLAIVSGLIVAALLLDGWYDRPFRARLTRVAGALERRRQPVDLERAL